MLKSVTQLELSRSVRFAVSLADSRLSDVSQDGNGRHNSFASWPSMLGLGAHYEITVSVRGEPDPVTGYLMNISEIDRAVRQHALTIIQSAVQRRQTSSPAALLRACVQALAGPLNGRVHALRLNLTPYYSLTMSAAATERVLMTQSFEFAAAHRLHCEQYDEETNRRIFGKCNYPSGHGHNYRLEVTVTLAFDAADRAMFTLQTLEAIVNQHVIQRFDHHHLNKDTTEFANLNPSVENIARVCHGLLAQPLKDAGAELWQVRVWETEKTSCSYPARST